MLQVLSEMVGAEELLRLIAFTKFVRVVQMGNTVIPVLWLIREFFPAVAAYVYRSASI